MVALGQTSNPLDLVPGDATAIGQTVIKLYGYGLLLTEAGQGLSRIDTTGGWTGDAADAFRQRFKGQPDAWLEAGSCFKSAAKALDAYMPVLTWAQNEAGAAIDQWAQGDKKGAQTTLSNAQSRLEAAANTANSAVGAARDKAPPHPGFWSDVGHFFSDVGHDLKTAGEDAVDALASLGNAALQNPGADLGMAGGIALAGISAGGEVLGVGLDLTGVGALVGVPVNVLSAAGMAAGTTLALASAGDLGAHATGDDQVEPLNTSGGGSGDAGQPGGWVNEPGLDTTVTTSSGNSYGVLGNVTREGDSVTVSDIAMYGTDGDLVNQIGASEIRSAGNQMLEDASQQGVRSITFQGVRAQNSSGLAGHPVNLTVSYTEDGSIRWTVSR